MVEQLTTEDLEMAKATEDKCAASKEQDKLQDATEKAKKTKEGSDIEMQGTSAIPESIVDGLTKSIEALASAIAGYQNPASQSYDASAAISEVQGLLPTVIASLASLPVPSIPGLSNISALLGTLASINPTQGPIDGKDRPEVPDELLATLKSLLVALQSLCTALPLTLLNVAFQMFEMCIVCFLQIQAVSGVPTIIPYPLNIAPLCTAMIPDIQKFAMNMPEKMNMAVSGKLRQMYKQIQDTQIPSAPEDIQKPERLPKCPVHQKEINNGK